MTFWLQRTFFIFLLLIVGEGWQLAQRASYPFFNDPTNAGRGRDGEARTGEQNGKNASEEDAVECPGAANRGDGERRGRRSYRD